ncbi:MAG: hypothetical protein AAFQ82_19580, partial [Myxococcota bacterium]
MSRSNLRTPALPHSRAYAVTRIAIAALLGALCALCACANTRGGGGEGLKVAVNSYHDNLRWKRINNASTYRLPDERAEFLARYLAVEDDLSIDAIEVRGVTFVPNSEPLAADVVVTAEAYMLPSTVLKKHVITERWAHRSVITCF